MPWNSSIGANVYDPSSSGNWGWAQQSHVQPYDPIARQTDDYFNRLGMNATNQWDQRWSNFGRPQQSFGSGGIGDYFNTVGNATGGTITFPAQSWGQGWGGGYQQPYGSYGSPGGGWGQPSNGMNTMDLLARVMGY